MSDSDRPLTRSSWPEAAGLMLPHDSRAYAMSQLRHLYHLMLDGHVRDMHEAATGILGPAIDVLEAREAPIERETGPDGLPAT